MNAAFDAAMARIVKEMDPARWDGDDVFTVVMTARQLQLDRRKLCRRLGIARNSSWSLIIVRLEKFLPCRECGLMPGSDPDNRPRHKFSCVTGAEKKAGWR